MPIEIERNTLVNPYNIMVYITYLLDIHVQSKLFNAGCLVPMQLRVQHMLFNNDMLFNNSIAFKGQRLPTGPKNRLQDFSSDTHRENCKNSTS